MKTRHHDMAGTFAGRDISRSAARADGGGLGPAPDPAHPENGPPSAAARSRRRAKVATCAREMKPAAAAPDS